MTKLDCVLKSKGIILLTKAHIVKAMVFSQLQMQELDHWRIDAFELWCWRRFLRVPWTARRSILKEMVDTWVFIGRADVKAETPILWPPDVKS